MRRLSIAIIAAASTVAFSQIAAAADMPVKAPPPVAAPVYNWTGFYVGGNVGYSWGNADADFNADPVTVIIAAGPVTIPGFVGSELVKPKGIIGGGQIGYNWQFSPNWVWGLEADIQASGEKANNSFSNPFSFVIPVAGESPIPVTGAAVTDYEAKILWFGTVRGRIGYAWDHVMLYATGGLAYGEVMLDGTRTVSGTIGGVPFSTAKAIGHSHVNIGWTVGAGVEGAIFDSRNWTWKLEYLYIDLGSLDNSDPTCDGPCPPPPGVISVSGGQTFTHMHFTDNIVRLGVNYKFW